ncbi:hypothetical protein ZHAS_00003623 [Anopheles sinensis]|uniref:Uncharacterized protein n=1 Tax=Anopheles sinensis TaxID=74873 RepID=A0A084VEU9_ANOSI|nr:hypothetical protein ZHAS_00003623 [Anopheles sinensis]
MGRFLHILDRCRTRLCPNLPQVMRSSSGRKVRREESFPIVTDPGEERAFLGSCPGPNRSSHSRTIRERGDGLYKLNLRLSRCRCSALFFPGTITRVH